MSKCGNTAHRKAKELRARILFDGIPTCELCGSTNKVIGHHCAGRKGKTANHVVNISLRCETCEQRMHHRFATGNSDRSITIQHTNNSKILKEIYRE